MAKRSHQSSSSRAVTPPKGRPTRSRRDIGGRGPMIGSTVQWVIVILLALAALIFFLSTVG